ncbi:MAG: polysaccharide deacetylase family protein [Bacteroidetes bacterium]|nr:polysaccharide deacetylase family protein [Bacteroidota bacterium]
MPASFIEFLFPVLCLKKTEQLYLTFDDGPEPDCTVSLLDLFERYNIPATFFLVGAYVVQYPDIVREIIHRRHSIGNHSYSHKILLWKKRNEILYELEKTNNAISEVTGKKPSFFRPPYGVFTPQVIRSARELSLETVLWSVDTRDFKTSRELLSKIKLQKFKQGDIILCHTNNETKSIVVPFIQQLVENCLEQKFTFAALENEL